MPVLNSRQKVETQKHNIPRLHLDHPNCLLYSNLSRFGACLLQGLKLLNSAPVVRDKPSWRHLRAPPFPLQGAQGIS